MPTRDSMIDQVVNQMMKGPKKGRVVCSDKFRESFKKRHQRRIEWVLNQLPRLSAAVAAVLVKCTIKHGAAPVRAFCAALKDCKFDGADDPVHLLWKYLLRYRGKDSAAVYQRVAAAAKAYMAGKKLTALRPVESDIFDWDDDYTVPDELLKNWNPDDEAIHFQIETAAVEASE